MPRGCRRTSHGRLRGERRRTDRADFSVSVGTPGWPRLAPVVCFLSESCCRSRSRHRQSVRFSRTSPPPDLKRVRAGSRSVNTWTARRCAAGLARVGSKRVLLLLTQCQILYIDTTYATTREQPDERRDRAAAAGARAQ